MRRSRPLASEAPEVVTSTLVDKTEVGGLLVQALESAYNIIRERNPDVPDAVIVISSADGKYGHFSAARWSTDKGSLPEIMVTAEGLKRPAREVLATLVHEAAHGVAHARGIQDVSDNGRYHNKKFAQFADELGLSVAPAMQRLGHSGTSIPEGEFDDLIETLEPKLVAYRKFDPPREKSPNSSGRKYTVRCECDRKIYLAKSTWEKGPIVCGLCGSEFE